LVLGRITNSLDTGERRISEDLGLWEPKRALTLEAALAHTRRIKVLRYILLFISVAIVGVIIWQFLSDQGGYEPVNDPSESVRMVNPRYSGRTGDGLPFYLIMTKILELETDVNLETDDGNICDTTHARIFNVEKRIEGDKAIQCIGEFGTVTGQTYAIEDAYRTFIFKDGMTADLKNEASASSDESSFGFGGDGPIDIKADNCDGKFPL